MTVRIVDAYPLTWREPDGTQVRVTVLRFDCGCRWEMTDVASRRQMVDTLWDECPSRECERMKA